jgi:hypothetical protein
MLSAPSLYPPPPLRPLLLGVLLLTATAFITPTTIIGIANNTAIGIATSIATIT